MNTDSEKLAYERAKIIGWNEALEAAAELVEFKGGTWDKKCAKEIRGLSKLLPALNVDTEAQ
jgi:hypothetical protein